MRNILFVGSLQELVIILKKSMDIFSMIVAQVWGAEFEHEICFCMEVRYGHKKIQRYENHLISIKFNTKDHFGMENFNLEFVFTSFTIFEI